MAQEYEQPVDSTASSRTQRMTAAESRAVIALWQQERTEQTGLTDRPALPDVAEGLDITVEDVQRLLMEVRARRLEEEQALIAERLVLVVHLAEEERKLAAVERHRQSLRPLRPVRSPRRAAAPRRTSLSEQDAFGRTFFIGGIILFFWFAFWMYHIVATALP